MGYQLWLPDALRDIGIRRLSVEPGWERRGSVNFAPRCVVDHHTGAASDITAMLRDGRPGLSGPLCNVEIRKSGEVRVIAAGRANHAGTGGFRGLSGNSSALGIEPTSDGKYWAPAVLDVYPLVNAGLCRGIGRDESWVCGHKEWTSRKWDPGALDMNWLRHQTGLRLRGQPTPPKEDPDMNVTMISLAPFGTTDPSGKELHRVTLSVDSPAMCENGRWTHVSVTPAGPPGRKSAGFKVWIEHPNGGGWPGDHKNAIGNKRYGGWRVPVGTTMIHAENLDEKLPTGLTVVTEPVR